MKRIEGWEKRFAAYLHERKDVPFEWGQQDCATFMFGAVATITGQEMREVTWTSALEAMRIIEEDGGLGNAACAPLGRPSQNWREIRRGDVATIDQDGRLAICVCTGQTLCGPGEQGLEHVPLDRAINVWRVG